MFDKNHPLTGLDFCDETLYNYGEKMPRRKALYNEYGVSGVSRFGGTITEEYLSDLRGEKGRKILKQMAYTDPTCGALLFVVKQMIRSADWEVRPAEKDNSALGAEAAEFVHECLHDMSKSWPSTVSGICSMFTYGWDYREICYKQRAGKNADPPSKYDDGKIGIRKLAGRSQLTLNRWEFDSSGGILGMWQNDPTTNKTIFIPIKKALLFRTEEDLDNPEGRSILATAYLPWYFLKNFREIEGIGVERDATGIPYLRLPAAILEDSDKSAILTEYKNLIVNIRHDEQEGILLPYVSEDPEAYKLEMIGSPGERQFDVAKIIDRCKAEIAQVAIADFILLGHQSVGSYALARTKKDAFGIGVHGWLDLIAGVMNSHLIPKLIDVNESFRGLKQYPYMIHRIAQVPSKEEINGLIRSLAFAKFDVSADLKLLNAILENYDLPLLSEEQYEALTRTTIDGTPVPNVGAINDAEDETDGETKPSGRT